MKPEEFPIDFCERPYVVIWELTQACDLACVHCRASAQSRRNPLELSTEEGKRLIDQIAQMQVPVFVLTGGDPIKRPDLFELIEDATSVGVRVSLTPSATPLLTRDVIQRLKQSGLARLAVSLDGSYREVHDAFRGMSGSFDRTMNAIEWANQVGLPVQINTTFTIGRAPRGLNDGKGFIFVSHLGEVFPSGFLPFSAGNVRSDPLRRIYRESSIFQQLRDDSRLGGKCGACEYRHICGGSRARAYALTGDPLAEESCCSYVPKNYVATEAPPSQWQGSTALHVL